MKYKILDRIKSPESLKKMSHEKISLLADEIRDFMVKSVSKTGGHLASSLGAVETTLALYRVFDPPVDKIIWDVGHQAYAHKIITGRKKRFHSLRKKGGISGFTKISESPYDAFGAGHTSTSISAALGFAKARDISGGKNEVVAVIGDASLANGMSLEAINHMGHDKTNMLIVVIDNEMSISPTVGALSKHLNNIMTGGIYNKFRQTARDMLLKIPAIGQPTAAIIKQAEESIKGVLSPGIIFEELGLRYFGPIDGHNIKNLTETLQRIKALEGPKLLHVYTKKGKGYAPAEKNPTMFHGIGKFNVETGEPEKSCGRPSYSSVFSDSLVKLAGKNNKIAAIVAAMIEGTNLSEFKRRYPGRFFDVGIAEEHAVTFAAGLAAAGMRPVVAVYSTFLQRGVDQIIHDAGLQKLPVVFAMDRAGIVGEDGPTHHGIFDIAFMKMIPNMIVMAPSDAFELERLMKTALRYTAGPSSIRFPRGESVAAIKQENMAAVIPGKARIVKKGSAVTIACLGTPLGEVINAAGALGKKYAKKIEIIDARFAKPLDENAIARSVAKTGRLITVEEGVIEGGFGQSVAAMLKRKGLRNFKVSILGIPDLFPGQGTMEELRDESGISQRAIEKAILRMLEQPAGR